MQCTKAPRDSGAPTAWAVIFYASGNFEIMKYTDQMRHIFVLCITAYVRFVVRFISPPGTR